MKIIAIIYNSYVATSDVDFKIQSYIEAYVYT